MNRLTLIIVISISSLYCNAQNATIKLKNGTDKLVKIQATSSNSVFTSDGNFKYNDMLEVVFQAKYQKEQTIYDRLVANGVKVSFTGVPEKYIGEKLERFNTDKVHPTHMDQNQFAMEKFRVQSSTGKGVMLVGIALIGGSVALANKYSQDAIKNPPVNPKDVKTVSPLISIAGTALFTIGIIVDLDARRHLKIIH